MCLIKSSSLNAPALTPTPPLPCNLKSDEGVLFIKPL